MLGACPCAVVTVGALVGACARGEPPQSKSEERTRFAFDRGAHRLVVEVVDDDVVHFELARADRPFEPSAPIFTTPMVTADARPRVRAVASARAIATAELDIEVDRDLCVTVSRRGTGRVTRMCASAGDAGSQLVFEGPAGWRAREDGFGLGQACIEPGVSGGGWAGGERRPGSPLGNRMEKFDGGACGNTQIPIVYGLGTPAHPFALFVDDVRAQTWDLAGRSWRVATTATALRWYLLAGRDLPEVRADYLSVTGRPPVPPRSAFGLWVSEYGYDDWVELEGVRTELRQHRFPVDGFVLDLFWFGGVRKGSDETSMGRLEFDTSRFPDPGGKIASMRADGLGVILIEESYVGRALPEHARLAAAGHLAALSDGSPVYLDRDTWWGNGGMLDWTHPGAGDAWHDWKRKPLIALGVIGHWIDLGEPEAFDERARYHGFAGVGGDHKAVHNLYNLAWAESIARGYRRHHEARRPFILSRSGTAGIQRTGVAMWSGDLASRYTTLAVQQRNQVHMSMAGVDYFGSDVGGYSRRDFNGDDVGDLYTRWLASAALTDVPLRPHTRNKDEKHETSPARVGHLESNLAAVRLRYQLVPYLYSLAHRAYRFGEPVFPPPLFYWPDDRAVRMLGDHKLIGRDLLGVVSLRPGERSVRVYLPAGTWFDFRTHARHSSRGGWLEPVPLHDGDVLRLPLYARAGAIIPTMKVDQETMNTGGRRLDGSRDEPLRARVYPSEERTAFVLYEDDGETVAYQEGEVRETRIAQRREQGSVLVDIGAARGSYRGAPSARGAVVEVIGDWAGLVAVELDGVRLERSRWRVDQGRVLTVDLPVAPVARRRQLRILTRSR